jgi:cysteine desulfurase
MAHYRYDLQQINIQCIVGSAHKFHGPKGVGFLYIQAGHPIGPFIHGGSQERNMRGGTENVAGIVGLAKAMELAYTELDQHHQQIQRLKGYMIEKLKSHIPGITFNGLSEQPDKSLYTVLNVSLPASGDNEMLLFNLDINGISASGGSAFTSGSNIGSHVLEALGTDPARSAIRFSFSKYNTREEVDYVVAKLAALLANDKKQILNNKS